jgi:hypothetical protein
MAPAFHEINLRPTCTAAARSRRLVLQPRRRPAGWPSRARGSVRLPYFHADITLAEAGGAVDYRSRRRRSPAAFRSPLQPYGRIAPAAPGSLELFLAERYLSVFGSGAGCGPRASTTRLTRCRPRPPDVAQTLTSARAAALRGTPALVHYAREVDVDIFRSAPP